MRECGFQAHQSISPYRRTVASQLPLATVSPSDYGYDKGHDTVCMLTAIVDDRVAVARSHKRTVSSLLPLATVVPSGLNNTLKTPPVCPVSVVFRLPVDTSHRRTFPSSLPLATAVPSGLNDILRPESDRLRNPSSMSVYLRVPVATSHEPTVCRRGYPTSELSHYPDFTSRLTIRCGSVERVALGVPAGNVPSMRFMTNSYWQASHHPD